MKNIFASRGMVLVALVSLAGCQASGDDLRSNVYGADQVNSRQEAVVVQVLSVMPARIRVDNSKQKQTAQVVGALFGAAGGGFLGSRLGHGSAFGTSAGVLGGGALGAGAGSLVSGQTLVDAVSLTYLQDGHTFNSAQVGEICEFMPGKAIVVSTSPTETRIQPNTTCPTTKRT